MLLQYLTSIEYSNNLDHYYSNLIYSHEFFPLSTAIFLFGIIGFLESCEFLSILINTEIMMLGINFHLITSAVV
jgi:NADH:ubiquinone oxidoreductase subunit K